MKTLVDALLQQLAPAVEEGHGIMDIPSRGMLDSYERKPVEKRAYERPSAEKLTLGQLIEYAGKKGFDVQFVDDVYQVADHGKWAAALLGKDIRVALKVGDYTPNEAELMAAVGHELGHAYKGSSEIEAQEYARMLFSEEFPHYAAQRAVERATANLQRAGELN